MAARGKSAAYLGGCVIALGLMPIGMLVGGVLIDSIGGTGTLTVMGVAMCLLALTFTQVRGLRRASLAPAHVVTTEREPLLPSLADPDIERVSSTGRRMMRR